MHFSPQRAPQGGSTVLKKIFPKALITKTMVLVNSQPPHTQAFSVHLNPTLTLPSPPKEKEKAQKQNKKKILAEGEESVPLAGLGQGHIYLPQHCSLSLTAPSTSPQSRNLTFCLLLKCTHLYTHTHKPAKTWHMVLVIRFWAPNETQSFMEFSFLKLHCRKREKGDVIYFFLSSFF